MNEDRQISFLDAAPGSAFFEYVQPSDKIRACLSKFGLTPSESKVIVYLGKYGARAAIEISRTLMITRTETYRTLRSLQNRGIVYASLDHPSKFSCLPICDAVDVLIEAEMENVKDLLMQKEIMMNSWQSIPSLDRSENAPEEKFQVIKGQNFIIGKISEMFLDAKMSLILFGPERFFFRLYHSDLLNILSGDRDSLRIITSCSEGSMHMFDGLRAEIRATPPAVRDDLCFVVRDGAELLSFAKSDLFSHDALAIFTDCSSLVYTSTLLFDQIWSCAAYPARDGMRIPLS